MKSHKPSKLIALGLGLTMGLSIPAALAASSQCHFHQGHGGRKAAAGSRDKADNGKQRH